MSRGAASALLSLVLVAGCGSSEPAAPSPEAAPAAPSPAAAPRVSLEEGGAMTLADALDQVARTAGVNVVVDPAVSSAPVDDDVRERANAAGSWRAALDVVAASAGCEVEERPTQLFMIAPHTRVDVAIAGLPARAALRLIAAWGGRSVLVARSVPDAPLDLALDGVKWRAALEQVVASLGPFEVVDEGDLLRVLPEADAGPLTNHEEADSRLTLVAGTIASATQGEVQLQPDEAGKPALRLRVPADERAHARRLRSVLANVDERSPRLAVTADGGLMITNAIVRAGKGAPR